MYVYVYVYFYLGLFMYMYNPTYKVMGKNEPRPLSKPMADFLFLNILGPTYVLHLRISDNRNEMALRISEESSKIRRF